MNPQNNMPQRGIAQQKYTTARNNLLLVIIFTVINMIMIATGSEYMMLFSATVPYLIVSVGTAFASTTVMSTCVIIALVIVFIYFLCWLFSKKSVGWMIAAMVLFIFDTFVMIGMYLLAGAFAEGIVDILFHIWILYYLIIGVRYGFVVKAEATAQSMPEQSFENTDYYTPSEKNVTYEANVQENIADTPILRMADMSVKHRVLLEANAFGHHVCYRRVKRVNELVIDGKVYDDVEMLIENAHALNAFVDGHKFQVGFDGATKSFLRVDGEKFAEKTRLW